MSAQVKHAPPLEKLAASLEPPSPTANVTPTQAASPQEMGRAINQMRNERNLSCSGYWVELLR